MRALVSLLTIVALALPGVQAQGEAHGEWVVPEGPHDLEPELETLALDLLFRYHCNLSAADPSLIHLSFNVTEVPPFAAAVTMPITTSTSSLILQEDWCAAQGNYLEENVTVITTTTGEAPAYVPLTMHVNAMVEYGSGQLHTVDGPFVGNLTFQATYFPLIQAIPTQTRLTVAPGETAEFHIDVTNFGNGPTTIDATWRPSTEGVAPPSVDAPAPTTLESMMTHGPGAEVMKTVTVRVAAPSTGPLSYVNDVYSFAVDFTGSHEDGLSSKTNNQTVFLSIQVQGIGAEAPAPVLALTMAAVVAAILLPRRRQ